MSSADLLQRGWLLISQSRYDLAERELKAALTVDPNDSYAHALLSLCYDGLERHDDALREAELAAGLAPDDAFAHHVRARALYHLDRHAEALSALGESIRLDPTNAGTYALLASVHFDQRRWAEALQAADQGLAHDPTHSGCANLRAMALVKLGRKAEARSSLEGVLARDPENSLSHANQGWTFLEHGDHAKALEHFREALRIDPTNDYARAGLVEALKARYWIYRQVLRFFLWMDKLSEPMQWVVILGIVFGRRILAQVGRLYPALAPVAAALALGLVAFVYLTWAAGPLFNLTLRFHPYGRYALTPRERTAASWVGASLLGGLIALIATIGAQLAGPPASDWVIIGIALITFFGLVIVPLSATFSCPPGWKTWVMGGYTGLLAVAFFGILGLELLRDRSPQELRAVGAVLIAGTLFGTAVSTWIRTGLAIRGRR